MTSYQRLKKRNSKLRSDIHIMIMKPDSEAAKVLRHRYQIEFSLNDSIWMGENKKTNNYDGLLKQNIL